MKNTLTNENAKTIQIEYTNEFYNQTDHKLLYEMANSKKERRFITL